MNDCGAIRSEMTFDEIEALPEFAGLGGYLMVCRPATRERMRSVPVAASAASSGSAYAVERIRCGLERVREIVRAGIDFDLRIWDEAGITEDPTRADVRLFHFPAGRARGDSTVGTAWVLVIPGGGYQSVCNAFEGFPVAAELNAAGYDAFVLSYRVRMEHLMPRPFDDVARAVAYIHEHASELGVSYGAPYAVIGFSAGGHLAAEWGTVNHGYRVYGQPAPAALVLCYPAIDVRLSAQGDAGSDRFVRSLIDNRELSALDEFAVNLHMDEAYPPTYIWQCRDDEVVPFMNYEIMVSRLAELGIAYEARAFDRGGHALMRPHEEEADRWFELALPFLRRRLGGASNL